MCLSGQPALELLLAACRKQDGGEWAWVVNVASTAAAVCANGLLLRFLSSALTSKDIRVQSLPKLARQFPE